MQRFIAHASDDTKTHPAIEARSQVTLAIGPEGGWTQEELDAALASGWKLLDLGETRLRIETAAIVGASRLISFSEQIPS